MDYRRSRALIFQLRCVKNRRESVKFLTTVDNYIGPAYSDNQKADWEDSRRIAFQDLFIPRVMETLDLFEHKGRLTSQGVGQWHLLRKGWSLPTKGRSGNPEHLRSSKGGQSNFKTQHQ